MRMTRLSIMTVSIAQTVPGAGLACLTALRDKERHATLLHVSSFTRSSSVRRNCIPSGSVIRNCDPVFSRAHR